MPAACIEASALQAQGICVVNPSCFITYVTDKEPARDMKPQFFSKSFMFLKFSPNYQLPRCWSQFYQLYFYFLNQYFLDLFYVQ